MMVFLINETYIVLKFFGIVVFILATYFLFKYAMRRRKYSKLLPSRPQHFINILGDIPLYLLHEKGSNGFPFAANFLQFLIGNYRLFENENIFCLWFSYFPFIGISSPEAVEEVLSGTKCIEKAWIYRFLHCLIGEGLITSQRQKWKSQRKLLSSAFHSTILKDFLPIIDEKSRILVEEWKKETLTKYTNVTPHLMRCSFDIMSQTILGVNLRAQENEVSEFIDSVEKAMESVLKRVPNILLWPDFTYFLTTGGRYLKKCIKIMDNFIFSVIRARKRDLLLTKSSEIDNNSRRKPLMDTLLEHHIENKNFTNENIREEVITFTTAGYETTAITLTWSLYLIGLYKDVQYKIHEELNHIFGDDTDKPITAADLAEMKYLECVIKESLRLYPPVFIFGRTASKNTKIGGYLIPEGAPLMIFPYHIHRNKKLYPNPENFDPDRFTPENSIGRHPYAFLPFSAGPRNCIGQRLAMMELKTILANILRNFTLESLDPRDKIVLSFEINMKPSTPIRIKFKERNKS